jgi:hypothetical protein
MILRAIFQAVKPINSKSQSHPNDLDRLLLSELKSRYEEAFGNFNNIHDWMFKER